MVRIRPALPADLPTVLALLKDCNLPWQDVDAALLDGFLLAVDSDSVVGTAGLERHGSDALLRSLAVRTECRSTGLGKQLANAIEAHARKTGVTALYLLTTTAADFFARRGYAVIPRQEAPATLQNTAEFSTLCPSQAVCMRRQLD
jgi:amino-acid N-acetyltransferase